MPSALSERRPAPRTELPKTIRVGIVGAGGATKLLSAFQHGFAGTNVNVVRFSPELRGLWRRLATIDVLQVIAWNASRYWVKAVLAARLAGKPVVRYWVGSDVLAVLNSAGEARRCRAVNRLVSANVAQWHNLKAELESLGIRSDVIPGPHAGVDAEPVRQLPSRFTVLTYLDDVRWSFYGGDVVLRLIRERPDWQFLILNHDGAGQPSFENATYLGHVSDSEIDGVYARASVLLRMTDHDGLPRMVLEALARGLHVAWNQSLPHCRRAAGFDEAKSVLESLQHEEVNRPGSQFVRHEYHPDVLSRKWRDFYLGL
jgi:hypothetical protein